MSLPQGWEFGWDDHGERWFFRHKTTGKVQYEVPTESNASGGGMQATQAESQPTTTTTPPPMAPTTTRSMPKVAEDDTPKLDATGGLNLSVYYQQSSMSQQSVVRQLSQGQIPADMGS